MKKAKMREVNFYAYETYCMVRLEERPEAGTLLAQILCHALPGYSTDITE